MFDFQMEENGLAEVHNYALVMSNVDRLLMEGRECLKFFIKHEVNRLLQ